MSRRHRLQAGGTVHLPLGALRLTATQVEMSQPARIELVGDAQPGDLPPVAKPNELLVTARPKDFTLRALPPSGQAVFAENARLVVDIALVGPNPESASTETIHVAGLDSLDLVRLTRSSGRQTLQALWVPVQRVGGNLVLGSPLARLARAAAAQSLGRAPLAGDFSARLVRVVVGIDGSASMRVAVDRADVAAVVDVIDGVQQAVLTGQARPPVAILRDNLTWVRTGEATADNSTTEEILAPLDEGPYHMGARLAEPRLAELSGSRHTIAYVVTNGMPGDLAAALALAARPPNLHIHLVVLGQVPDHPSARLTVVPLPDGTSLHEALRDKPRLHDLTASLLRAFDFSSAESRPAPIGHP
jgi:hypothetical protein